MKTAILSDIHSNLEALERVCAHAFAQGAERFVCLGDLVGYGADPAATLERLMRLPGLVALRGNHDEALFRDLSRDVVPGVSAAIEWTRSQLSAAQLEFLSKLPYLHREPAITYVHANAREPERWEYVFGTDQAEGCMEAAGTPLTFIGHVHEPRVFYTTGGGALRELRPVNGVVIPLSSRARYVVNVGSVGQPRDGDNGASYVIHDEAAAELAFHRVAYDYAATGRKILDARLDPFFAERLARGR